MQIVDAVGSELTLFDQNNFLTFQLTTRADGICCNLHLRA